MIELLKIFVKFYPGAMNYYIMNNNGAQILLGSIPFTFLHKGKIQLLKSVFHENEYYDLNNFFTVFIALKSVKFYNMLLDPQRIEYYRNILLKGDKNE
ncbi:MAG: hypothetical protein QXU79_04065 [Candidatus Micrarchaeaceae archaeon]